jgi:hypothetical protein
MRGLSCKVCSAALAGIVTLGLVQGCGHSMKGAIYRHPDYDPDAVRKGKVGYVVSSDAPDIRPVATELALRWSPDLDSIHLQLKKWLLRDLAGDFTVYDYNWSGRDVSVVGSRSVVDSLFAAVSISPDGYGIPRMQVDRPAVVRGLGTEWGFDYFVYITDMCLIRTTGHDIAQLTPFSPGEEVGSRITVTAHVFVVRVSDGSVLLHTVPSGSSRSAGRFREAQRNSLEKFVDCLVAGLAGRDPVLPN